MHRLLLSLSILLLLACGNASNNNTNLDMAADVDLTIAQDMTGVPTISTLTPASGPIAGGTDVTITGTNFDPSTVANLSFSYT